jgi:ABC-type bacteriocin/lantibiotic exporter with double-glycine peptidase domain
MNQASFMAFSAAYGALALACSNFQTAGPAISNIRSAFARLSPIMETAPEIHASGGKVEVTHLSGNIEINNVSFRYNEDAPLILNNISLKIKRGQYVAIVGKTGCGKSTLLRLLLGFEKPLLGSIYYDGKDLGKIDLKSLRGKVGVDMQNGKLFPGTIYENIAITKPGLTLDEAWEAAEIAGIADDIRAMPMTMWTFVAEAGGGISGGQRQRVLIARAIAAKPRILFLDEATSALDNVTQRHVAESLGRLASTRVVIAHRLSTIKNCDRIIVLDGGKIAEDGTYDELYAKGGIFKQLVERQIFAEESV